ncbi:unnamed protein product [Urochloa humidicola]
MRSSGGLDKASRWQPRRRRAHGLVTLAVASLLRPSSMLMLPPGSTIHPWILLRQSKGDSEIPVLDGRRRWCPEVLRCAPYPRSSRRRRLAKGGSLPIDGFPDELELRDHDIVSAAKIHTAHSRVHE